METSFSQPRMIKICSDDDEEEDEDEAILSWLVLTMRRCLQM